MVTQQVQIPNSWPGSGPEYIAYSTFIELGREPGQDFTYQSPLMGGRLDKGGFVIDFMFSDPPDLAINVQGVYYHYEFGVEAKARDVMARASLAGQNITLIFIDDDHLLSDPRYYCREALNYRDHSRLGGG
jgi:hypothetical protein|tara:strand:- start:507 stop:899 length:393 start_codon:yes stop_codon:yes gene_type:complete